MFTRKRISCVLLNKLLLQKSQVFKKKEFLISCCFKIRNQRGNKKQASNAKIRSHDLFIRKVAAYISEDKVKTLSTWRERFYFWIKRQYIFIRRVASHISEDKVKFLKTQIVHGIPTSIQHQKYFIGRKDERKKDLLDSLLINITKSTKRQDQRMVPSQANLLNKRTIVTDSKETSAVLRNVECSSERESSMFSRKRHS